MQALALSCLVLLAAESPRSTGGVDADVVLQRMVAMDGATQQAYLADLEKRLDRANRLTLAPEEAAARAASVAAALRQNVVGWDLIRELVQETDRRERAAISKLVRQCRMKVYETYYGDRKEYDQRLDALNRVSEAWYKQATFDEQPIVVVWMVAATASAMPETKGPLPPEPKFARSPDAATAATGTRTPATTTPPKDDPPKKETPRPESPKPETPKPKPETPKPETPKPPPGDYEPPKPPVENEADLPKRPTTGGDTITESPVKTPEMPKPPASPTTEKPVEEMKGSAPKTELPVPSATKPIAPTKPVTPPIEPPAAKEPVKAPAKTPAKEPVKTPAKAPPDEDPFAGKALPRPEIAPPLVETAPVYEAPLSIELGAIDTALVRAEPGVTPRRIALSAPVASEVPVDLLAVRSERPPLRREAAPSVGGSDNDMSPQRSTRPLLFEHAPVSLAVDDPASVELNVAELAARVAGNSMQLRALEAELDNEQGDFSPATLDKALRRLSRLVEEQRHLAGFYTLIHAADRPRVGEFESPLLVAAQLARRIREAQRAAAGDSFAGGPNERQSRLDLLDGMVQSLEKLRAGR